MFLSYAREDLARVQPLVAALEAAGLTVWYDQSLRAGADFGEETAAALDAAKKVLVVWSANSISSKWVRDEAAVGRDRGALIPITLDQVEAPLGFRQIQSIDFGGWRGDAGAVPVARLLAALKDDHPQTISAAARSSRPAKKRRRALWFGAGAVALVASAVAAVWFSSKNSDAPGEKQIAQATPASSAAAPGGAPAATSEKSVAVLPFVALSSGEDDAYFADGLTEEIINALTTVPDLLVTARTSAFHYKGKDTPVPEIARTLGVAHVVEGSVRRAGDKVRITAQLIRASDGFHLWSEAYDRTASDDFVAQTEIAESVARALGVLLDESFRSLMADAGVGDVEAFLAYRRGRELFNIAHSEGPMIETLAEANKELEAAIARKPDFASAHFLHSDLYGHILSDEAPGRGPDFVSAAGIGVDEAARRLYADLEAAYRHEPHPGQRLLVKALLTTLSSDWRGLKDELERGYASLNNCRNELWFGRTARVFGYAKLVHARDAYRTRCDPFAANWAVAAESAVWAGAPSDAFRYADRAEALRGPGRDVLTARIYGSLALGRIDDADVLLAQGDFDDPTVPETAGIVTLQVAAAAGRVEEWERLRPILERDPERALIGAALFGDRETANRTAASIDAMTFGSLILVRSTDRCGCGSPFDLSATPNFARLVRESGLDWAPPAPIRFPLKDW